MEKEIFNNNKIREALCQFTFKEIKDNTIFGRYWDNLIASDSSKFSNKENLSSFQFTMKGGNPGEIIPSMVNSMKFSSKDNKKVIQLHYSTLSIHQLGNYEKWEVYREDIKKGLKTLIMVEPIVVLNRIDLRAINEFSLEKDVEIKDYFNVYPLYNNSMPFSNPDSDIKLSENLDKDNHFILLNIIKKKESDSINIIVDISFVALFNEDNKINCFEDIKDCLEYGHENINKVFYNIITSKTKEIIK